MLHGVLRQSYCENGQNNYLVLNYHLDAITTVTQKCNYGRGHKEICGHVAADHH